LGDEGESEVKREHKNFGRGEGGRGEEELRIPEVQQYGSLRLKSEFQTKSEFW